MNLLSVDQQFEASNKVKDSTKVQEFLNCSFDAAKLEKFDSYANLWFVAFGVVSLSLAILQTDNFALNENLGFLSFVISGVLNLAYKVAKHHDRIDIRISIFRWLRWYILMLLCALIAVFGWFIVYEGFLQYLGLPEPTGQNATFIIFSATIILLFQFPVKWLGHRFLESIRCMLKEDNELTIEVATKFMPTGVLVQTFLFLVNSVIFLAILEGTPFYPTMILAIVNQPGPWAFLVGMLLFMGPQLYKRTISEQASLIRQIKIKKSNIDGDG